MANKIKIQRGLQDNLPELDTGELAFTTDTEKLYVGGNSDAVSINDIKVYYIDATDYNNSTFKPDSTDTIVVFNENVNSQLNTMTEEMMDLVEKKKYIVDFKIEDYTGSGVEGRYFHYTGLVEKVDTDEDTTNSYYIIGPMYDFDGANVLSPFIVYAIVGSSGCNWCSALAYDLQYLEHTTNKITSMTGDVDNRQYPSAQAVKSYCNSEVRSQWNILGTPGSSNLGKIRQYVGQTNQYYTKGQFYCCVSDGQSSPTYSWEPIDTQKDTFDVLVYSSNAFVGDYLGILSKCVKRYESGIPFDLCLKTGSKTWRLFSFVHKIDTDYEAIFVYKTITNEYTLKFRKLTISTTLETTTVVSATLSEEYESNLITSGSQTIPGAKTFSSIPSCSVAPYTNNNLVNKTYVDGCISSLPKSYGLMSEYSTVDPNDSTKHYINIAKIATDKLSGKIYRDWAYGSSDKLYGADDYEYTELECDFLDVICICNADGSFTIIVYDGYVNKYKYGLDSNGQVVSYGGWVLRNYKQGQGIIP